MSDFYELLCQATGKDASAWVQMAPRIDPKRLANASKWAQFGQEQPTLFIDDTVFGSGKSGVLLTSHALYFDTPKTRIELSEILEPPTFPEGVAAGGSLRTRGVEVKLPSLLDKDAAEVFKRVLLAIVAFNRGTSGVVILPVQGPVGSLAMQLLKHEHVNLAPDIPRKKMRNAAAAFPDWLDHAGGEQPLAYLDETTFGTGSEGLLLTDRRLLAYTREGTKLVSIPFGAITGASSAKTLLGRKLKIEAAQYSAEIPLIVCGGAVETLVHFFRGMQQISPNQRWAPPISHATAQDPSGAFGLLQTLGASDARIPILLRFVGEVTRQGAMDPAMGADLVTRIHLLHRTLAYGRGMAQGFRTSPLHSADFHYMLSTVFGDPISVVPSQQPPDPYRGTPGAVHHTLDFALGRRPNIAGVATAVVGLALLAVVGVGFLATPKNPITGVRVVTTDLANSTGFVPLGVQGTRVGPLAELAPDVLERLLDALDNVEALITFYRVVFGWRLPPQQLLQWGAEVPARVGHVLGPTDLSAFDRASD